MTSRTRRKVPHRTPAAAENHQSFLRIVRLRFRHWHKGGWYEIAVEDGGGSAAVSVAVLLDESDTSADTDSERRYPGDAMAELTKGHGVRSLLTGCANEGAREGLSNKTQ